jgi:hypothetical protein
MRWLFDNAQNIQAIVELVLTIVSVIGIVFMVWLRKSTPSRTDLAIAIERAVKPLTESVADAKKTATEALGRVGVVEGIIDRHATKDDVSEILRALERQDGDRRTLGAEVRGMREGFVRIEQQLDMLMQEALRK